MVLCSTMSAKQEPITLTSPIIEFIDGKSWGINGQAIGYMRQVGLNILKMQFGEVQKDSTIRIGLFEFEGKKYSIRELMIYEKQLIEKASSYQPTEYEQLKRKLQACLNHAKEVFIQQVKPFMDQAQGTKEQVVIIMQEWAQRRNRPDSYLLHWSKVTEENEFILFHNDIVSFFFLDQFCSDLVCYLSDLMRSCPKANVQFEQLKEQFLAQQR